MNIQPIFLRVWVEKKTPMPWTYSGNISTTSLVLKANLWRGGTLNVISAHDVLVDHCYTTTSGCCYHRINCQQSGLSQTIQPPVCTSLEKVAIIVMCMGNWTRLTDFVVCDEEWQYPNHWVLAEVGSSECIKLIPLIAQGTSLPSWAAHQKFHRTATCAYHKLPTTDSASCNMSPGTRYWMEWWKNSTVLFQVMLSRQHRWIDLQWLSTIGSLPLPPNSFPSNV